MAQDTPHSADGMETGDESPSTPTRPHRPPPILLGVQEPAVLPASSTPTPAVVSPPVSPLPLYGEPAVAAQLAQEPIDPLSGGVDSGLVRAAVREFCTNTENAEILVKDLLLHPSPVNSRRLAKFTFYGLNLHFELVLIAWYFFTALQGTYVWMAWQTQHEENACWITMDQHAAFEHPANFLLAWICFDLFLPYIFFESAWCRVWTHAADTVKQPVLATLGAAFIAYFNNVNVAFALSVVLAWRELRLSYGATILRVLNEVKGTVTITDPLPPGEQSIWWSSKAPEEYCREESELDGDEPKRPTVHFTKELDHDNLLASPSSSTTFNLQAAIAASVGAAQVHPYDPHPHEGSPGAAHHGGFSHHQHHNSFVDPVSPDGDGFGLQRNVVPEEEEDEEEEHKDHSGGGNGQAATYDDANQLHLPSMQPPSHLSPKSSPALMPTLGLANRFHRARPTPNGRSPRLQADVPRDSLMRDSLEDWPLDRLNPGICSGVSASSSESDLRGLVASESPHSVDSSINSLQYEEGDNASAAGDLPSDPVESDPLMTWIKTFVHAYTWLLLRLARFAWNEIAGGVGGFFGVIGDWFKSLYRRWSRYHSWLPIIPQPLHQTDDMNKWLLIVLSVYIYHTTLCLFTSILLFHSNTNENIFLRWVIESVMYLVALYLVHRDMERENNSPMKLKSKESGEIDSNSKGNTSPSRVQIEGYVNNSPNNGAPSEELLAFLALSPHASTNGNTQVTKCSGSTASSPSPSSPRGLVGYTFLRHPVFFLLWYFLHSLAYLLVCPKIDHTYPGYNSAFYHVRISVMNLVWHYNAMWLNVPILIVAILTLLAIQLDWTGRYCRCDLTARGKSTKKVLKPRPSSGVKASKSRPMCWSRFLLLLIPLLLCYSSIWHRVTAPCHIPLGQEESILTEKHLRHHTKGTRQIIMDRIGMGENSTHPLKDPYHQPLIAMRAAHSKQHGCVKARFSTPYFIPAKYRYGLFSDNVPAGIPESFSSVTKHGRTGVKEWDAFIRFSSGQSARPDGRGGWKLQPDSVNDVRGMAVKVILNPETKKYANMSLTPEERKQLGSDENTQDFITISSDAFFVRNPTHFAGLTAAASTENPIKSSWDWLQPNDWFCAKAWRVTIEKLLVSLHGVTRIFAMNNDGGAVTNPLRSSYYSAVPYRLGPEPERAGRRDLMADALAVKYQWRPCEEYKEEHEKKTMHAKEAVALVGIGLAKVVNTIFQLFSGTEWNLIPLPNPKRSAARLEKEIRSTHPHNYLRQNLQNALHPDHELGKDACFQLLIQEQADACVNPIEDASKSWIGKWYPVARLDIPQQFFQHTQAMEVCENLSFNPWHSLAAHRPMGDLNKIRKFAYSQSGALRRSLNDKNALGPVFTGEELPVLIAPTNWTGLATSGPSTNKITTEGQEGQESYVHASFDSATQTPAPAAISSVVLYGNPAMYDYLPYPAPWSGLPAMIKHLPHNETFSFHSETLIAYNTLHSLFSQIPAQPRQRSEMTKLQHFEQVSLGRRDEAVLAANHLVSGRMRRPAHVDEEVWTTDEFFGMQFIRGLNPMKIIRVTEDTPMTPRLRPLDPKHRKQVKEALQGQDASSLEELAQAKRLLFADYPEITNLTTVAHTVLYAPVVVFYLSARNRHVLPLLIQLETYRSCSDVPEDAHCTPYYPPLYFPAPWVPHLPGATFEHPIVPNNTAEALGWMFAKMHAASADAQSHQLISHLLETHLVLETTIIATHRALSEKHYLHRLLRPHFKGTLSINDFGRMTLVSYLEPFVDAFQSIGMVGAHQMMARRYQNDLIYMETVPAQMRRRGFAAPTQENAMKWDTPEDLPGFLYRDYGLPLFYLFREYVLEVLATVPEFRESESPEAKKRAMDADPQLQSWFHEVFTVAGIPLRNRPDPRASFDDFVDLLAQIIFQATAQHAAVNFPQYEFLSFSPIRPLSLSKPMPSNLTALSERYIVESLVDDYGLEILHTTYDILSTCCANTLMLDESEAEGMLDSITTVEPTYPELWDRLREKLKKLQKKEQKHNKKHGYHYPYLYPSRIPYSTAI